MTSPPDPNLAALIEAILSPVNHDIVTIVNAVTEDQVAQMADLIASNNNSVTADQQTQITDLIAASNQALFTQIDAILNPGG